MSDDVFGEAPDAERERRVKVVWPCRPVNMVEGALNGAMYEAMALEAHRAPTIWIEDDTWTNAADYAELYGELTLQEAVEMQGIIFGDVQEQFRRQLIVARECGESATLTDYLAACAAEGIDPLRERIAL